MVFNMFVRRFRSWCRLLSSSSDVSRPGSGVAAKAELPWHATARAHCSQGPRLPVHARPDHAMHRANEQTISIQYINITYRPLLTDLIGSTNLPAFKHWNNSDRKRTINVYLHILFTSLFISNTDMCCCWIFQWLIWLQGSLSLYCLSLHSCMQINE